MIMDHFINVINWTRFRYQSYFTLFYVIFLSRSLAYCYHSVAITLLYLGTKVIKGSGFHWTSDFLLFSRPRYSSSTGPTLTTTWSPIDSWTPTGCRTRAIRKKISTKTKTKIISQMVNKTHWSFGIYFLKKIDQNWDKAILQLN